MITIQCTKKLLKEVGQEHKEAVVPTVPLGCWHANLLMLDRRKCVLFTNDKTRYSFLVPGLKKPDFKVLDEVFGQALFKCLMRDGFSQESIELVLDEIREVAFTTTSNRSVLGTMNDVTTRIKLIVWDEGGLLNTDIAQLNQEINTIPSGAMGYKFSIEKMRELLG